MQFDDMTEKLLEQAAQYRIDGINKDGSLTRQTSKNEANSRR